MKIFNNVGFWEFLSVAVAIIVFLIAAGLIILRFFKKSSNQVTNQIHVTPSGIVFSFFIFGAWLATMGWAELHPDGWLHGRLSLPIGVLCSGIIMLGIFMLLAKMLEAIGITLFTWKNKSTGRTREG